MISNTDKNDGNNVNDYSNNAHNNDNDPVMIMIL